MIKNRNNGSDILEKCIVHFDVDNIGDFTLYTQIMQAPILKELIYPLEVPLVRWPKREKDATVIQSPEDFYFTETFKIQYEKAAQKDEITRTSAMQFTQKSQYSEGLSNEAAIKPYNAICYCLTYNFVFYLVGKTNERIQKEGVLQLMQQQINISQPSDCKVTIRSTHWDERTNLTPLEFIRISGRKFRPFLEWINYFCWEEWELLGSERHTLIRDHCEVQEWSTGVVTLLTPHERFSIKNHAHCTKRIELNKQLGFGEYVRSRNKAPRLTKSELAEIEKLKQQLIEDSLALSDEAGE